jgi:hypothetical protein
MPAKVKRARTLRGVWRMHIRRLQGEVWLTEEEKRRRTMMDFLNRLYVKART